MISRPVALLALAVLLAAGLVYRLNYTVDAMERELTDVRRATETARWDLKSLEASWAYVARPERLARLAEELGMVPMASRQVVDLATIGTRREIELAARPVPVLLPSGEALQLRLRPPAGGLVPTAETGR